MQITFRLFGRFSVQMGSEPLKGLNGAKVQELLAFLLLQHDRPQSRDVLAGVLWGDSENGRAKKYLRQALWQLQSALRPLGTLGQYLLRTEADWIELRTVPELRLDVAVLEEAALALANAPLSEPLAADLAQQLRSAIRVYEAPLLQGWYQDWCGFERERLQGMLLNLLDALAADCEARGLTEEGLRFGALSLRHDRACERAYQRIMRLHWLAGRRAAALRQYDRCVIALDEELGVGPARETTVLYERIRSGRTEPVLQKQHRGDAVEAELVGLLEQLKQIDCEFEEQRRRLQVGIDLVEQALARTPSVPPAPLVPRPLRAATSR